MIVFCRLQEIKFDVRLLQRVPCAFPRFHVIAFHSFCTDGSSCLAQMRGKRFDLNTCWHALACSQGLIFDSIIMNLTVSSRVSCTGFLACRPRCASRSANLQEAAPRLPMHSPLRFVLVMQLRRRHRDRIVRCVHPHSVPPPHSNHPRSLCAQSRHRDDHRVGLLRD